MKIRRTIPPAAPLVGPGKLLNGLLGIFSGQGRLKTLDDEVRAHFGVRHAFLVSSGKAALTLTLKALKQLSPGKGTVVIPAYTCFSVPSAVIKAGLKVTLCDIDQKTLGIDSRLLEKVIDEKTLCVVVNHLFGIPSDTAEVIRLCAEKGIFVVEDAAQAMGAESNGRLLGTIGDTGFFSLGRGKNITAGSGAIIVTNSDRIASSISREYVNLPSDGLLDGIGEFLKLLFIWVFIRPSLYWLPSGLPFLKLGMTLFHADFPVRRLSGLSAGLMRGWEKELRESNRVRIRNAAWFCGRLGLKPKDSGTPYLRLPLLVQTPAVRDEVFRRSADRGLGLSLMYPCPVDGIEDIKGAFRGQEFPVAKDVCSRLIALPTHHLVTEKDREAICELFERVPGAESLFACDSHGGRA